jgi:hypothetical protein
MLRAINYDVHITYLYTCIYKDLHYTYISSKNMHIHTSILSLHSSSVLHIDSLNKSISLKSGNKVNKSSIKIAPPLSVYVHEYVCYHLCKSLCIYIHIHIHIDS